MSPVAQVIDQRSHLFGIGLPLYLQIHPHERPRARPGREPSSGEVGPSSLFQQDHRHAVFEAINDAAHHGTVHLYLTAATAGVRIVSALSRRPSVRRITAPSRSVR